MSLETLATLQGLVGLSSYHIEASATTVPSFMNLATKG